MASSGSSSSSSRGGVGSGAAPYHAAMLTTDAEGHDTEHILDSSSRKSYAQVAAREAASIGPGRGGGGGGSSIGGVASRRLGTCCGARITVCSAGMMATGVVLVVVIAVIAAVAIGKHSASPPSQPLSPEQRVCTIFCEGPVLAAMQDAMLFNDSKTFVDMPLRSDPEDVMQAFHSLPDHSQSTLRAFLLEHFMPAGSDLLSWTPPDFQNEPAFLGNVHNATLATWASDINQLWKLLGRKVAADVLTNPQRHTLLPLKNPTVVPGGRFRETYYWDTYWIVRGLLVCDLKSTAVSVAQNLLDMAKANTFVPNGARAYYLHRSQPPVLSLIVHAVYNATGDADWLAAALPVLRAEHDWWMTASPANTAHAVVVQPASASASATAQSTAYTLNRYVGTVPLPRPESYREDIATARRAGHTPFSASAGALWMELRGAAETGWDFSSRWFADHEHIDTVKTSNVIPADLNAILYRVELALAELHAVVGDSTHSSQYSAAASSRATAMRSVLWDEQTNQWKDFYISSGLQSAESTLSNWIPVWAGLYDASNTAEMEDIVQSLKDSELDQAAGLATTDLHTGQQWDWPNAWPPLQHFLIEGLRTMPLASAHTFATSLARRWLYTGLVAYNRGTSSGGHFMYEKYNATDPGHGGAGGEYVPQKGFGWTNGVALELLNYYGKAFAAGVDP